MDWSDRQRRALARITAPRSRREEVYADVEFERGLSDQERDERIRAVVRAAFKIASTRSDRDRLLEPEPPAPDFAKIRARLVAQRRAGP